MAASRRGEISNETPPLLKVGLCQIETREWDFRGNLERTLAALRKAADLGAQLAITPECVLDGYPIEKDRDALAEGMKTSAEPVDGERIGAVRRLLAELGLPAVVGFTERDEEGRIRNTAGFFGADGAVLNLYRKVHCRMFEAEWGNGLFTPGESYDVVSLDTGDAAIAVGTMICFDREVAESARCLRSEGAEVIACPNACMTTNLLVSHDQTKRMSNDLMARARAAENEVAIVLVNHAGRFNGGSFVAGPLGEIMMQMSEEPGVEVFDVPVGRVREMQAKPLGWMGQGYRRPEIYRKYLNRAFS